MFQHFTSFKNKNLHPIYKKTFAYFLLVVCINAAKGKILIFFISTSIFIALLAFFIWRLHTKVFLFDRMSKYDFSIMAFWKYFNNSLFLSLLSSPFLAWWHSPLTLCCYCRTCGNDKSNLKFFRSSNDEKIMSFLYNVDKAKKMEKIYKIKSSSFYVLTFMKNSL